MGIQSRKEREKNHRREQILNAAITLIENQGFENTTMDEIAEEAELSKGTLYLYFNDKQTLHQAIKKRALQFLHDKFLIIIQKDLKGAELVNKMMIASIELIHENVAFTKAMIRYEIKTDDDIREDSMVSDCTNIENELMMLTMRAIQIGFQDGSINSPLDPKILALQIGFQMRGMIQFSLTKCKQKDLPIMSENNFDLKKLTEQFLKVQFNSN
ncbi:MAG: TetR/AcrR family transcriptional regulator [Balneola sp.]